jgi:hypothetical protein
MTAAANTGGSTNRRQPNLRGGQDLLNYEFTEQAKTRTVYPNFSMAEYKELVENQLIMIEPNPCTPDYRAGIFLGDVGVVRKDGWQSLHRFPLEFVVVDG